MKYQLPYGDSKVEIFVPEEGCSIDILVPGKAERRESLGCTEYVTGALSHPLGTSDQMLSSNKDTKVAITINDKTRPVPNSVLIPPLIEYLYGRGIAKENISFYIASGTHKPMDPIEFSSLVGEEIANEFAIFAHNCDDNDNLYEIGKTSRQTPVLVNQKFYDSDVKIVVGDIELHHFAGYSGGVKSAAIGLCSRLTINTNHRLLLDPRSTIGIYTDNPLRQDIEEIGRMIGVDFALNAILDEKKEIIDVFFGEPDLVMQAGIKVLNRLCRVPINDLYDVVIASAGGYPKDINLYQSQKAMTHASQFCRRDGVILLFAECREGVGSPGFLGFMKDVQNPAQAIEKFEREGFSVGPHKAYQIARILENNAVYLWSSLKDEIVSSLMLRPLPHQTNLKGFLGNFGTAATRIAILPFATACIPQFTGGENV